MSQNDATEPFFARADEIFEAALDLEADERQDFLDAACGTDRELRRLVERLLANSESDDGFLTPGGGLSGPLFDGLAQELIGNELLGQGTEIGRYRVVREIGRGGMAVVYLADRADGQFEQQVALKVLQQGGAAEVAIQRFDQERQILAQAHHPNIAQLLDGGVDPEGRPFIVMEYVEGLPIDRYCDQNRLSVEDRLGLFLQVARAVDYAHRNLVVHRDIKPSNILVSRDPLSRDSGHAKLLDFGIAKLIDEHGSLSGSPNAVPLTRTDSQLMTPLYASPEQIRGEPVTTVSDVYQLGLLLYMLLTGRWPYHLAASHAGEVVRAICNDQPTRPSTAVESGSNPTTSAEDQPQTAEDIGDARGISAVRLQRQLAGDLDNITLMALRKEPERRYRSVAQLIDDVENYLADRPVSARADTLAYRMSKLMRRHKAAFSTAAAAVVMLASLILFYTVRLADERDRARLAAAQATEVSSFLRGLFAVSAPTRSLGEQVTARELLDRGSGRIELELADQPALRAAMMTLMGDVYRELAHYEEAVPLLEQAVAQRRRQPGEDSLELAESLELLAAAKAELEDFEVARRLYQEALDLRQAALGPSHPLVGRCIDGLGRVAELEGEYETALEYHRRAAAIFETSLGPTHPEVGLALTGVGEVLGRIRAFEESRKVLGHALTILEESHSSAHPRIAHARVYFANALRFTGKTKAARKEYEAALEALEMVYGPDHPEVAVALTRYGHLLNVTEDSVASAESHSRALKIRELAFGPDHPLVASSLNNLGLVKFRLGEVETAQELYEQSIEIWENALGPNHPDVAIALRNLADLLRRQPETLEQAAALLERVVEIRRRAHGANHSLLAAPLAQLGATRLSLGETEAAESLLRQALELGRNRDPHRHPEIIYPRIALGRCLMSLDRHVEAEELLLRNLEEEGVDMAAVAKTREVLAELYESTGRLEEAENQRRASAVAQNSSPPSS